MNNLNADEASFPPNAPPPNGLPVQSPRPPQDGAFGIFRMPQMPNHNHIVQNARNVMDNWLAQYYDNIHQLKYLQQSHALRQELHQSYQAKVDYLIEHQNQRVNNLIQEHMAELDRLKDEKKSWEANHNRLADEIKVALDQERKNVVSVGQNLLEAKQALEQAHHESQRLVCSLYCKQLECEYSAQTSFALREELKEEKESRGASAKSNDALKIRVKDLEAEADDAGRIKIEVQEELNTCLKEKAAVEVAYTQLKAELDACEGARSEDKFHLTNLEYQLCASTQEKEQLLEDYKICKGERDAELEKATKLQNTLGARETKINRQKSRLEKLEREKEDLDAKRKWFKERAAREASKYLQILREQNEIRESTAKIWGLSGFVEQTSNEVTSPELLETASETTADSQIEMKLETLETPSNTTPVVYDSEQTNKARNVSKSSSLPLSNETSGTASNVIPRSLESRSGPEHSCPGEPLEVELAKPPIHETATEDLLSFKQCDSSLADDTPIDSESKLGCNSLSMPDVTSPLAPEYSPITPEVKTVFPATNSIPARLTQPDTSSVPAVNIQHKASENVNSKKRKRGNAAPFRPPRGPRHERKPDLYRPIYG